MKLNGGMTDKRALTERLEVRPKYAAGSVWGTLRWVLLWLVGTALFYLLLLGVGEI